MSDPTLFDQETGQLMTVRAPYVKHSATSHAAARQIVPLARNYKERVFAYIEAHPGATDEMVADGTRLNPSTVRPRRVELAREGRIVLETSPRMTRSGRKAQAWRISTDADQGF